MADDVGFLGLQRAQYTVLNAFPKIAGTAFPLRLLDP
jgi:hypothetical protein